MTSEAEERPRVVMALYGGLGVNGLSESFGGNCARAPRLTAVCRLCLNPTAQKDNRGVLGTTFRAEEFSEIVGYSNMADYSFS